MISMLNSKSIRLIEYLLEYVVFALRQMLAPVANTYCSERE